MAPRKKRRTKKKPTAEQIEQRNHRKWIRSVFRNAGFQKVNSTSDKEFTFDGITSDFDDVFTRENVIIFAEYTIAKQVTHHLKGKGHLYSKIADAPASFLEFFESTFPTFKAAREQLYSFDQCEVVILYCPKNSLSLETKSQYPHVRFLDFQALKYFQSLTESVKLSARFELYRFLGLEHEKVGPRSISTSASFDHYRGFVLPETSSNYPKGYKVVSFYADPESLLSRSYVLRNDSWADEYGLYQRMISRAKINQIRKHVALQKRVFINNIVVTLPPTTKILDEDQNTVEPANISTTSQITIQIEKGFNVLGIVDGQHRVFSYHEGGKMDSDISVLRKKQNLLVTGIIYPGSVTKRERSEFEARLFLEINSNQTSAKTDLKQAIELMLNPFSAEAIAKAVLNRLNEKGPLADTFERHFFDQGKLKTSSIVSFALRPIVKTSGTDSFYAQWTNQNKKALLDKNDDQILEQYIEYSAQQLNWFFAAVKSLVPNERWTTDKSVEKRLLSIVIVNGLIICLRKLVEHRKTGNVDHYKTKLKGIERFAFEDYRSSQYARMADDIASKFFGV